MPTSKTRFQLFGFKLIILNLCIVLFTGCAAIDFKNKHDLNAFDTAKQISDINKEIKTAKGLGWLKIEESNIATIFKIAWISMPPHKIRITLISNGFPVETIVSNEENITLFSHTGEHSLKTYSIKNPSLEKIISIPVRIEDIILLLSGQIPIKDFKYAFFDDQGNQLDNKDNPLRTIVLKNNSDNGIQKIFINSKDQIKKYTAANRKIETLYTISFLEFVTSDSVIIPSKMIIKDNLNRKVYFEISKFYKNPPVKKSMFSLTEKR